VLFLKAHIEVKVRSTNVQEQPPQGEIPPEGDYPPVLRDMQQSSSFDQYFSLTSGSLLCALLGDCNA
jgi:hypothetical protein